MQLQINLVSCHWSLVICHWEGLQNLNYQELIDEKIYRCIITLQKSNMTSMI
ncbi:hypothetical protein FDUTEX481_08090 [Tolypothrix sp. PCC 7601]|nr:hypothetical protein FDUTEX481_08090 [Tolypothrix sp. PCC 7601]